MTIAFPRAIFQDAHLADKLSCGNRAKKGKRIRTAGPAYDEDAFQNICFDAPGCTPSEGRPAPGFQRGGGEGVLGSDTLRKI
jgi:hypothetical protein